MYLNDTQRVELSLPCHMMLAVAISGANCADPVRGAFPSVETYRQACIVHRHKVETDEVFAQAYGIFLETKTLLIAACDEPMQGIYPPRKYLSLVDRVTRLHRDIVQPYMDAEAEVRKVGLIAFHLIQMLVETSYLIVPPKSHFGRALDIMLPALSPWEGSTPEEIIAFEKLNKSAEKQARKIMKTLQDKGYYRGLALAA